MNQTNRFQRWNNVGLMFEFENLKNVKVISTYFNSNIKQSTVTEYNKKIKTLLNTSAILFQNYSSSVA
jgi:hypothetical protein